MDNRYMITSAEIQRLLSHDLTYILRNPNPSPLCGLCSNNGRVLLCSRCILLNADHRDAQIRAELNNINNRNNRRNNTQ